MSNTAARRILVVEDDAILCSVLERNLRARGSDAQCIPTVHQALAEVGRRRPDMMLVDIGLPDGTGWDLLRALRARAIEVPTVVISATRVVPERLAEFRPLAYLPKPFPLDALLRLVNGTDSEGAEADRPNVP